MAAGGPGTLPLLRPRGLVSMPTPTANWPELLKAVALEVLGANPQSPGYDMQEPERKHGGDRQSIWSIPKSEQATSSASSSSNGSFSQDWPFSPTTRTLVLKTGAERNGHHRPHGRHRRGRRRIVADDRRGRETGHGGSKIHRGKVPEPPQGKADKARGRGQGKRSAKKARNRAANKARQTRLTPDGKHGTNGGWPLRRRESPSTNPRPPHFGIETGGRRRLARTTRHPAGAEATSKTGPRCGCGARRTPSIVDPTDQ